jgi:hypothetical protein
VATGCPCRFPAHPAPWRRGVSLHWPRGRSNPRLIPRCLADCAGHCSFCRKSPLPVPVGHTSMSSGLLSPCWGLILRKTPSAPRHSVLPEEGRSSGETHLRQHALCLDCPIQSKQAPRSTTGTLQGNSRFAASPFSVWSQRSRPSPACGPPSRESVPNFFARTSMILHRHRRGQGRSARAAPLRPETLRYGPIATAPRSGRSCFASYFGPAKPM